MKPDELLVRAISFIPLMFLAAIFIFLLYEAFPSIVYNGFKFLTTDTWNPGMTFLSPVRGPLGFQASPGASFGVQLFLLGTLLTSALAMALTIPLTLIISISLSLYLPNGISSALRGVVQLFAAIPSVVYGLWGVVFLEPILLRSMFPSMEMWLGFIPWFAGPATSGSGIVASSMVLVMMVVPITSSVALDAFINVRGQLAAPLFSLGATRWEVAKAFVSLSKKQLMGASFLGLGRALGETMAVLMTCGGAINSMPSSIYSPINTMAAAIASLLDSAFIDPSGMTISALAEVGLLLLLISVASSATGRKIVGRVALRGELE
ncbi:MAG: phosphate ABC transporter permease subunit PstC [Thermoprotei archaeon]|jgi:phosphate transport system permease protein